MQIQIVWHGIDRSTKMCTPRSTRGYIEAKRDSRNKTGRLLYLTEVDVDEALTKTTVGKVN